MARTKVTRAFDDGIELQHLLPSSSRRISEDTASGPETETDLASESDASALPWIDLQQIISGSRQADTRHASVSHDRFTERKPRRKVVDALTTLLRDIDRHDARQSPVNTKQHPTVSRKNEIQSWLDSATRFTPCTRSSYLDTSPSRLIVPQSVRDHLQASRHESWDDGTRKAARTVTNLGGIRCCRNRSERSGCKDESKSYLRCLAFVVGCLRWSVRDQ